MAESVAQITFLVDGEDPRVVAVAEGETLMHAAVQAGVPQIIGECGGELSCATCHVWLSEDWPKGSLRRSADEVDLLEADDNFTNESRLSCQVRCTAEMDGLTARVPDGAA